jgi:coproporphyrinogen III oxidase-like Fe-S oxidoreductase
VIGRLAGAVARRELARVVRFGPGPPPPLPRADGKPRLLYLHVPFCESLCPYCSFHRVAFDESLCRDYFVALRREIRLYRERGFQFSAVYIGGGTPTVMVEELKQTLDLARDCFRLTEVSVETNPNHLTPDRLRVLKEAGVNRLSVGIQTFDDALLRTLNRYDRCGSGNEAAARMGETQGRFDTLNADMMFNLPFQDAVTLDRDLDVLLDAGIDQVTYYPLMVTDSTRQLVNAAMGRFDPGPEERSYRQIVKRLTPAYSRSSAWCFSRSATRQLDEYIVSNDEYAGLGSGSIGYIGGVCYANTFDISRYIADLGLGRLPIHAARAFGTREQARYDFLMKLFAGRLDLAAFRLRHRGFYRHVGPEVLALHLAGALRRDGQGLYLTGPGWYCWVALMREFFIAVNNLRDDCRRGFAD